MSKTKQKKKKTTKSPYAKYIKLMWMALLLGLLFVACLFIFITKTQLPDTNDLEQPDYEIATVIKSNDGRELGKAFKLNREWISPDKINPIIKDALVSTEDERFYKHSGIDAKGTARALVFMGRKGGASTITQQLAKLFFTQRSRSFIPRVWQKLKEWVIAIEFEKRYTKDEILVMYLNKYDYLYNAIGIGAAAKTYFGKDQADLGVEEAAVLVGLLKNPWIYNPIAKPENANKRRAVVMKQMVRNGKLDLAKYKELNAKPIDMSSFKRAANYGGVAPYFRAELVKRTKEILDDPKNKKPDGTKYDLFTDGLVINTTIDLEMQKHAEAAAKTHMSQLQEKYFSRWKGMDPWTYNADDKQKKIRQSSLLRQIRESDRFLKMRKRYIGGISSEITKNIDKARLYDGDIFRLFAEDKKEGTLANLVRKKTISRSQSKVYKKILDSKYWPELKKKWTSLQKAKDRTFKKKVKMKVFAYTDSGEKTVNMSPLDSIKYHNMHLQIGSISVDPKTGYIKTWVGGSGHKYFKFDHINSNRQVGSTFKPFIYGTAIIKDAISPCEKIRDIRYSIPAKDSNFNLDKAYSPDNASGFSGEYITLKDGLKKSLNSVSVKLMKDIGNVQSVLDHVERFGIKRTKVPPYPSMCLGSAELSVMDMAGAYTVYANDGIFTRPTFIKSIEDANGRPIYVSKQERKRAISSGYNYAMLSMLKHAQGWIYSSRGYKSEVGGKTGTTNDHKNGWFMGVTPELVVATWVGGDNEWIRFLDLTDGQGGRMARPFFSEFLKRLENDASVDYNSNAVFKIPEIEEVELDCDIYDQIISEDEKNAELEKAEQESKEEEFEEEF